MKKQKIKLPYLDDFFLNLQANNYSPKSIYNYERDLSVFNNFLEEAGFKFDQIDKKTILNYKAYLISRDRKTPINRKGQVKLSSYSINRMLSALRSYLKFLIDIDYKTPIVPEVIKFVKTEKKSPRVSEIEELISLIESPTRLEKNKLVGIRNRAILEMLFSTGMRISEIINLKKERIDNAGRILIMGKGRKERFVYLTDRAKKYLNEYLALRNSVSSYLFVPYRGKNIAQKDKKISPNYLQERVKRYREILGLNIPISCHSIRHAFATYLAEKGASATAIQILLGHESLSTTTRYIHASDRYAEETHHKYHPLNK